MLDVRALLLTFSSHSKRLELALHLDHGASEIRQLAGDPRGVLTVSQTLTILCLPAARSRSFRGLLRGRVREVSPKRIPETEQPTQRNGRLLTHLIDPRRHDD